MPNSYNNYKSFSPYCLRDFFFFLVKRIEKWAFFNRMCSKKISLIVINSFFVTPILQETSFVTCSVWYPQNSLIEPYLSFSKFFLFICNKIVQHSWPYRRVIKSPPSTNIKMKEVKKDITPGRLCWKLLY